MIIPHVSRGLTILGVRSDGSVSEFWNTGDPEFHDGAAKTLEWYRERQETNSEYEGVVFCLVKNVEGAQ